MECGKYDGVRQLEHWMKVYEYVLGMWLRDCVDIGNNQLGFCQGKSTTGSMFVLRMLVDLEKTLEYHGKWWSGTSGEKQYVNRW